MHVAAALIPFSNAALAERPWSRHLAFLPPPAPGGAAAARRYTDALAAVARRPDDAVAIDVQLPFCPMQCSYCAFDVTVTRDALQIDRYIDALETEIALVADHLGERHDVVQLHFGGGTPNYLSDAQLERIVRAIGRRFRLVAETESTIDCDPRRASARQLDTLRALGFGHLRLGMADLRPEVQRAVGRIQSAALMRDVCDMAREAGFETVGIDLLYGLPGQSEDSLRETLAEVVALGPDRVCCHPYVHRPNEHWHQCAIDRAHLPAPNDHPALFRAAADTLTSAGYTWIGLDHFVLDTDEIATAQAEGRLRCGILGYTAMPQAHVLGFGAGALSDVAGTTARNESQLAAWTHRLGSNRLPVAEARRRSADDLRCCEAIARLLCDLRIPAPVAREARARLAPCAAEGLVAFTAEGIRVTPSGRYQLERLCAALQRPPETRPN